MRKIRLLKLINEYNRPGFWTLFFLPKEDKGIRCLEKFLNSPQITSRSNLDEVTYQEFIDYLLENKMTDEFEYIHDMNYQKVNKDAAAVFKKFFDDVNVSKPTQDALYDRVPIELWFNIINFLDISSLLKLSQLSYFYYDENKKIAYWRKTLSDLGFSQTFIVELAKNTNMNFKKFSYIIAKFELPARSEIVKNLMLQQIPYVNMCKNSLDLAALSGNVNAMKSVVSKLHSKIKSNLTFPSNTLYCAILSENKEVIEYAIKQLKINPKQNQKLNALYLAASEKKETSVKYLLELNQIEGLGLIEDLEKKLGKEGFVEFLKHSSQPIQDLIEKDKEAENEQAITNITDEL